MRSSNNLLLKREIYLCLAHSISIRFEMNTMLDMKLWEIVFDIFVFVPK